MPISVGQFYRITGYHRSITSSFARRLTILGITPGTVVSFVRAAPLGDPLELKVAGISYMIRRSDVAFLEVEPSSHGSRGGAC